jgi:Ala-tRNA(Pro) deacylase
MNLFQFLRDHAIDAPRHEHVAVMTCEEADRLVPRLPGSKTKNLFLRDKKGMRHLLVSVPPDRAVDLNALGVVLGAGRLGFASAERLHKHLGITPARVSLLAGERSGHAVDSCIDARWGGRRNSAPVRWSIRRRDPERHARSRTILAARDIHHASSMCRAIVAAT